MSGRVDAVVALPRSLHICNTHSPSCQEYHHLKAHKCIPPWELHLNEGRCFIQGYVCPHPQGQAASNDWSIQVQRPNSLTSIGNIPKWSSQLQNVIQDRLRPLLQLYVSPLNFFCHFLVLLLPQRCCCDDSPLNLQMQIPGSVFASWGTQLAIGQEETHQVSQFSNLWHQPRMATKALLGFSFSLHEPSLSLSPSPESGNTARKQNGHLPQQGYSLSGIPIHRVFVAFTAVTCL